MFLATRELQHSRLRYLLICVIMALIAWLVFLLSGLANGLADDNAGAILRMNATHLIFQSDARFSLNRSLLDQGLAEKARAVPGVIGATPMGYLTATTKREGSDEKIDATILAIEPGSFLAPPIVAGRGLDAANDQDVVVDQRFQRQGIQLGDLLKIAPSETLLKVVGFTSGQTYGHLPVIFTTIPLWQSLRFPVAAAREGIADPISAIAAQMDSATAATQVTAAIPDIEIADHTAALDHVFGYKEEMNSLTTIQGFLFLIAAFIMAVFFYVLTLQKTYHFGILKALGASTGFLARDLIGQVIALSLAGVLTGSLLTYGVAAIIPESVPFALRTELVAGYGLVLLVVALAGSLLSLRHIATVDPLLAIGRMD